jgi:hypothetical protein
MPEPLSLVDDEGEVVVFTIVGIRGYGVLAPAKVACFGATRASFYEARARFEVFGVNSGTGFYSSRPAELPTDLLKSREGTRWQKKS